MSKVISFSAVALMAATTFAGNADLGKWDSAMAESKAQIDTNGVKWIDGIYLPIEGRWTLGDTENYYSRLPDTLTTNVNRGVRGMRCHASGMQFRFKTNSKFIVIRHNPYDGFVECPHFTQVGFSGWDVYRFNEQFRKWRFVASNHTNSDVPGMPGFKERRLTLGDGEKSLIINLPLYNSVRGFFLGIEENAKIEALPPRQSGVTKPVVFYGTSITHGGCASRPGLGFVNIIGRQLDVPVHCLGFSGSGIMEYELSDVISRIDASCYVLDCLWNMGSVKDRNLPRRNVEENYEKFIRNLRAKRPDVPIVMAGQCDVFCRPDQGKDTYVKYLYAKLLSEGWKNLYYLPKDGMLGDDFEGTVDGCHPNDIGMQRMADRYGAAVKKALGL